MNRRNVFGMLAASFTAMIAMGRSDVRAQDSAQSKPEHVKPVRATKVAYHLSDLDKVNFVLGNIKNHIEGTGGPGKVEIILVVHGPALRAFRKAAAEPQVSQRMAAFSKAGVKFDACGNTLHGLQIGLDDLVPGFSAVDEGGVVRLADLQAQGYAYLRP